MSKQPAKQNENKSLPPSKDKSVFEDLENFTFSSHLEAYNSMFADIITNEISKMKEEMTSYCQEDREAFEGVALEISKNIKDEFYGWSYYEPDNEVDTTFLINRDHGDEAALAEENMALLKEINELVLQVDADRELVNMEIEKIIDERVKYKVMSVDEVGDESQVVVKKSGKKEAINFSEVFRDFLKAQEADLENRKQFAEVQRSILADKMVSLRKRSDNLLKKQQNWTELAQNMDALKPNEVEMRYLKHMNLI